MLLPVRGAGGRDACAIRYYTSWLNRRKHIWTPKAAKEHCPGPAVGDGFFPTRPARRRTLVLRSAPYGLFRRTAVLRRGRAGKRPFSGGGRGRVGKKLSPTTGPMSGQARGAGRAGGGGPKPATPPPHSSALAPLPPACPPPPFPAVHRPRGGGSFPTRPPHP